jgi:SAM-dependent methyltransferase
MFDMGFPDLKITDYQFLENKEILNIGGGNCADVWYLAKNNKIYAIDGSDYGVEEAKKHGIEAAVGDVSLSLHFQDKKFDIIILKDILEHIYNPIELLFEAKRVLKDSGYIILSLPNHFYFLFRLRILFGGNLIWKDLLHDHTKEFDEWNYQHVRFFTYKGLKKMLSTAGCSIEKAYWDFGTLAHYSDPDMYKTAFRMNRRQISSRRQWLMYKVFLPFYSFFNFIFPKSLRSLVVSLAPGLLCAGFYLKLVKSK